MQNEPEITQADLDLFADSLWKAGYVDLSDAVRANEVALPDDTYAALICIAKARQQGREEGLREAANKIVRIGVDYATNSKSSREFNATVRCQKAILALIEKERQG